MIDKLLIFGCKIAIDQDEDDSDEIEDEADREPYFDLAFIFLVFQKEPELKPVMRKDLRPDR